MPTHASSARSTPKSSSPMRLIRRLRNGLRSQAKMMRTEAKARWKSVEGQLEHPDKWVKRARKVVRKARHRVSGLRTELVQALKNATH